MSLYGNVSPEIKNAYYAVQVGTNEPIQPNEVNSTFKLDADRGLQVEQTEDKTIVYGHSNKLDDTHPAIEKVEGDISESNGSIKALSEGDCLKVYQVDEHGHINNDYVLLKLPVADKIEVDNNGLIILADNKLKHDKTPTYGETTKNIYVYPYGYQENTAQLLTVPIGADKDSKWKNHITGFDKYKIQLSESLQNEIDGLDTSIGDQSACAQDILEVENIVINLPNSLAPGIWMNSGNYFSDIQDDQYAWLEKNEVTIPFSYIYYENQGNSLNITNCNAMIFKKESQSLLLQARPSDSSQEEIDIAEWRWFEAKAKWTIVQETSIKACQIGISSDKIPTNLDSSFVAWFTNEFELWKDTQVAESSSVATNMSDLAAEIALLKTYINLLIEEIKSLKNQT